MNEKESWFIRLLKWLRIVKEQSITNVTYREMCKKAQSVCNRNCSTCIWNTENAD